MIFIHDPVIYNTKAAQEIVPILINLLQPTSVIDVGCGIGTWLSVFQDFGVEDILGIDGEYVDRNLLHSHIDESKFIAHKLTQPFKINRKFDLVISLEVAEHLPEESADIFVNTLVSLGDYIVFSAAIPNQGGEDHINEQWPTYWSIKFKQYGFDMHDCIRFALWSNTDINWWYKQNIFLVVKSGIQPPAIASSKKNILPIVHPELYNEKLNYMKQLDKSLNDVYSGQVSVITAVRILLKALQKKVSINKY
jgi:SAM-dependent methyltransferase